MKRLGLAVALALLVVAGWWLGWPGGGPPESAAPASTTADRSEPGRRSEALASKGLAPPAAASAAPRPLTAAEKAVRIEQIKRDYDEVRAKIAAEYAAAGKDFPGGLNAFLRQLALLEREKRADFATLLNAAELEALEYRETTAGKMVAGMLQRSDASDEVKRAVFRQQLAYEDRFALTFDITPKGLLERETARQAVQREIRGILGDALFSDWLLGEGSDIEVVKRVVKERGLPPERVLELWELKNEFTRRRLEVNAREFSALQRDTLRAELVREMNARVDNLLGPNLPVTTRREGLGWLPEK